MLTVCCQSVFVRLIHGCVMRGVLCYQVFVQYPLYDNALTFCPSVAEASFSPWFWEKRGKWR